MPDGYSVSLDQFTGLNAIGETGLRDLVNHHYVSIFGASLALAAIGGVAQIGNGYGAFTYDPMAQMRNGISQSMAESSQRVLDRFLNQLPTFVVRERTRVKIYLSDDLLLPAYVNHTMPAGL
jgi:type IV secretion system protein VirB10